MAQGQQSETEGLLYIRYRHLSPYGTQPHNYTNALLTEVTGPGPPSLPGKDSSQFVK